MSEMDEMPRAERIWTRADWMVGVVAAFVAGVVCFWTAAPNVTLLDSGEFVVAAQHFGVPHPTGYPLWTLLAWLFQLLPFGNAAWEINLFSGFCGALATGFFADPGVNAAGTGLFFGNPRQVVIQLVSILATAAE